MPYTGDSPTNPVALTLTSGAATGQASGASDHDRHVCWFSVPAQAAGKSVLIQTLISSAASQDLDVCIIWDGGNTAHYINDHRNGVRQMSAYRPLPAGVSALIGVFPRGAARMPQASVSGVDGAGATHTAAAWAALYVPDLTKRLPPNVDLSVVVENTAAPSGSSANPQVLDFTVSLTPVDIDFSAWTAPDMALQVHLPSGYVGIALFDGVSTAEPSLACGVASATLLQNRDTIVFKIPTSEISPVVTITPGEALPSGTLTVRPLRISNISGDVTDINGTSPEPVNILLYRTNDAVAAVQAPSGSYTIPNVTEGDYVLVAYSQDDGRDVRATNVLIPQGTRAAGGGYPFVPPPGG
jgi:hypothetical protein